MSIKFKKVSGAPVLEQITDETNILVEVNGTTHKISADKVANTTDPNCHAEYFDITDEGLLSLKPEYRGIPANATFTYAISDRGATENGSKNSELPEHLVINEIAVTTLCEAIVMGNNAIKSITIPKHITHLPHYFARKALSLVEVKGTEQIKSMGKAVLGLTPIRKAYFPNLKKY